MVIPRQQAFYGTPFHASRGLATGDIPAPTIYNIVTDAILRRWYLELMMNGLATRAASMLTTDNSEITMPTTYKVH